MKTELKIKDLKWLYFHKNKNKSNEKDKVVMFFSKYNDFKKLTSTQKILDELLDNYDEDFLEKMWLNTTIKIKNFLVKQNIEVVEVISCFKDNNKSKPIAHYPHTFYEIAIKVINKHLENWDDSKCSNSKLEKILTWNKISNIIDECDQIMEKCRKNKLDELDKIYENIHKKNTQVEFEKEIKYINDFKSKIVLNIKNNDHINWNNRKIHTQWAKEFNNKISTSSIEIANIFNIINEKTLSKDLIST